MRFLFDREVPLRKRLRRIPQLILGLQMNVVQAGLERFRRRPSRAARCDIESRRNGNAVEEKTNRGGLAAVGIADATADLGTSAFNHSRGRGNVRRDGGTEGVFD